MKLLPLTYRGGQFLCLAFLMVCGLSVRAEDAASTVTNSAPARLLSDDADTAWKQVQKANQAPFPPAEWSTNSPTQQEKNNFFVPKLMKVVDMAAEFYTRFPNHPKAPVARDLEIQLVKLAITQFDQTNQMAHLAALEQRQLSDPNASADDKVRLRIEKLAELQQNFPATFDAFVAGGRALIHDYPKRQEGWQVLMFALPHAEGDKADALATEILNGDAPDEVKAQVRLMQRVAEVKTLMAGLPATADVVEKKARDLVRDFPGQTIGYQVLMFLIEASGPDKANALAAEILKGDAPEGIKAQVRLMQRVAEVKPLMAGLPETSALVEQKARELVRDFPGQGVGYEVLVSLMEASSPDKARALAGEIAAGPAPENIKQQAEAALKMMDRLNQPLDIHYTAVDGREVNLATMKNKVVLVDFWATWCGPCMAELPDVKTAYTKYHDQGFDIVGISLDQEKDKLESTLKSKGMTWPQFYDGMGFQNKIALEFGIRAIPAMWLVDKQGKLADLNAGQSLDKKIEKLLAQKKVE